MDGVKEEVLRVQDGVTDRAAAQATREFPEFLGEMEGRGQRRKQHSFASPRRSFRDVDHASGQTETRNGDPDQAP